MKLKRFFSLFLVLVLLVSLFPSVRASETTVGDAYIAKETASVEEVMSSAENTISTETSSLTNDTGNTKPTLIMNSNDALISYDVTESITSSNKLNTPHSDNFDNTIVSVSGVSDSISANSLQKNSEIGAADTYSVSTLSVKKSGLLSNCVQMDMILNDGTRQAWHYVDEDEMEPLDYTNIIYCLENQKTFSIGEGHAGISNLPIAGNGNSHGESIWYGFSADQRTAIALVLLYGCPTKLWNSEWGINTTGNRNIHNPNMGYRFATQALIWEFAAGLREATPPYTLSDTYWYDRSVGQCMSEDGSIDHFLYAYNSILTDLQLHNNIPSFTGDVAATAPEIQLAGNSITVIDSNDVLSRFTFSDSGGVSYSKNGNNLTITVTGTIPTGVQSAIATLPDPASSLYEVWYNQFDASKQACIKVSLPASDPVPAYFKLKALNGSLNLKKTTEDEKNLAGWQFSIYSDQNCTKLISGLHTSDANGNISVPNLTAGQVWVKEIGHTNSDVNMLYTCDSANPQAVTIVAGQATSVSFYNKLILGVARIVKTATNGGSVSGWHFTVKDSAGNLVGNYVTDATGVITLNLKPGTFSVTETDGVYAYWHNDPQPTKSVTVKANETATVTFTNQWKGKAQIIKTATNGGSVAGWHFTVKDSAGKVVGNYVTDTTGIITLDLEPGSYSISETDGKYDYWHNDPQPTKTVTVKAGETAKVTFTNQWKGKAQIIKTATNGGSVAGWHFEVKDSAGNVIGNYVTDAAEVITLDLDPGTFFVTETDGEYPYWHNDPKPTKTVTVKAGETAKVTFTNKWVGKAKIVKTTTNGGTVAGWEFTITNATGSKVGTYVTNAAGTIVADLEPGSYTIVESDRNDPYWYCDTEPQTITVKAGETSEVTFHNQWIGKAKIIKTLDNPEAGTVDGWTFTISRVNDTQTEYIATVKTGADGTILYDLEPGQYQISEVLEENSLWQCVTGLSQVITVKAGETAEVTFTNALRPGKISVQKVDIRGESLSGAKFVLQWSEDGITWNPVFYSDSSVVVKGGCSNKDVVNGSLVSPDSGLISWDNLYPTLQYRILELEAPEGYVLLSGPAYEGELPVEELTVSLRVVNNHSFTLPETGSKSMVLMPISVLLCLGLCASALVCLRKRRQ